MAGVRFSDGKFESNYIFRIDDFDGVYYSDYMEDE